MSAPDALTVALRTALARAAARCPEAAGTPALVAAALAMVPDDDAALAVPLDVSEAAVAHYRSAPGDMPPATQMRLAARLRDAGPAGEALAVRLAAAAAVYLAIATAEVSAVALEQATPEASNALLRAFFREMGHRHSRFERGDVVGVACVTRNATDPAAPVVPVTPPDPQPPRGTP